MRHERKRRKACRIFCAAVVQRYLLVHARITFASGKISPPKGRHGFTSKIQNGKSTTSARDMEARFRRTHQREAVPQRPPESTDCTNGTYHKHNNGDGGLARKCSIAMRSSYNCPCSMMTERSPPKIRIFRAFYENIDEMLQEIT